jgi:mannose-6-phosphate isomerase
LPSEGLIGEAWALSDRDEMPSRVKEGPLAGRTLRQLIEMDPKAVLGRLAGRFDRLPLLIKYLDAAGLLSVQVHPPGDREDLNPRGEAGKSEAWVVLAADPGSVIYAGLKPGASLEGLRALSSATAADLLSSFAPQAGETVRIDAGVVHTLGGGLVVLEVQQNSDVTFRLYDWDRVDTVTGLGRALQVEKALSCIDPDQGAIAPTLAPTAETPPRETLLTGPNFSIWRLQGDQPMSVGAANEPRALVALGGAGCLVFHKSRTAVERGDVLLLPASLGEGRFLPSGQASLLEVSGPAPP